MHYINWLKTVNRHSLSSCYCVNFTSVLTMNAYATLIKSYALHLKPLIPKVAKSLCYGCEVDHPSQIQHDVCLMMETEERVRFCLREAADLVDDRKVMAAFQVMMNFSRALRHPAEVYVEEWRRQLWEEEAWCDRITAEIVALMDA